MAKEGDARRLHREATVIDMVCPLLVREQYYHGQWPFASAKEAAAMYAAALSSGRWRAGTYPKPPYKYAKGIEVPSKLGNLTTALLRRGFGEKDVRKIMGENLVRVFTNVWR